MSRDRGRDRDGNRDSDVDDLPELLDDLRTTLDELDRTVGRGGSGRPRDDRREPREPASTRPRGRDVVRFTEEYTIPTAISILETTVQSLELLQGVLRLADPERRGRETERRGRERGRRRIDDRLTTNVERALDELREVVTGTEPPSDPVARDVFEEARRLTTEVESILTDAREDADRRTGRGSRKRRASSSERRGVVIPVDDSDGESEGDANEDTDEDAGADDPRVDIDAELESIRDEVETASSAEEATDAEEEEATERGPDDEPQE